MSSGYRFIAGKQLDSGAGWCFYTAGLNSTLQFYLSIPGYGLASPVYTITASDVGKILTFSGVWDYAASKARLYVKRNEVGTGTSWTNGSPWAPNSGQPFYLGKRNDQVLTGAFSLLWLGEGDGIPTLAEVQAQHDAIASDEDFVPIPGKDTAWWSLKRSQVGGALPTTLVDQKSGLYPLALTGAPAIDPIFHRAVA